MRFNPTNKHVALDNPTRCFLLSLRRRRKAAGFSQRSLAEVLNVVFTTIGCYETGRKLPNVKALITLADILDVDLSDSINYKLFYNLIDPRRLREMFSKFGLDYEELSTLTGYSPQTVKDSLDFNNRATPQSIAAVIDVLEREREACNFRQKLLRKGRRLKHE